MSYISQLNWLMTHQQKSLWWIWFPVQDLIVRDWTWRYLMAMSCTLMFSWDMLSRRSGSLMFWKRGRSCTSQFMARRCNKQVCTQDRAGSRALWITDQDQDTKHFYSNHLIAAVFTFQPVEIWVNMMSSRHLLFIQDTETLHSLHQHEHQLMVGMPHLLSKFMTTVWQLREITEK